MTSTCEECGLRGMTPAGCTNSISVCGKDAGRMMNRDQSVALCCALIGLLISVGSLKIGLGNFRAPRAGLFPFLVGSAITLLGGILYVEGRKQEKKTPLIGTRWKNLLLVLGCLLFYATVLDWLGFAATTLLFMVLVLKTIEPQKWSVVLVIAVLSTSFTYLLFSLWLKIEFPRGILGW